MMMGLLARLVPRPSFRRTAANSRLAHRRSRARAAVFSCVLAALAISTAAGVVLDDLSPPLRDPEYARRVVQYRQRVAEHPGRSMVLVIGSSRAAMGVCPAAWEAIRGPRDPMIFNLSVLGSGPVMELVVARRALADGLRPDIVLFEYWPPYLYSEKQWTETKRIPIERLSPRDQPVVNDYFPNPGAASARIRRLHWNPLWESRERLLVQYLPKWMPNNRRIDWTWQNVDAWGWKPGFDFAPGPTPERATMLAACANYYQPLLAEYRITPSADRALREAVALARSRGAVVGLVYLPESSEFRSWYPAEVERVAREHLAALASELALPVINAREWVDDGLLVDGFHLSRTGAEVFTRKFGPAIAAAFPEARR